VRVQLKELTAPPDPLAALGREREGREERMERGGRERKIRKEKRGRE